MYEITTYILKTGIYIYIYIIYIEVINIRKATINNINNVNTIYISLLKSGKSHI